MLPLWRVAFSWTLKCESRSCTFSVSAQLKYFSVDVFLCIFKHEKEKKNMQYDPRPLTLWGSFWYNGTIQLHFFIDIYLQQAPEFMPTTCPATLKTHTTFPHRPPVSSQIHFLCGNHLDCVWVAWPGLSWQLNFRYSVTHTVLTILIDIVHLLMSKN